VRRAARIDRNQVDVVIALRKIGATVQHLHTVGGGCPDLLVGFRGRNMLLEVKSDGGLNDLETEWHRDWRGKVATIYTPEEAIHEVGKL
jgi:hypothetical protein